MCILLRGIASHLCRYGCDDQSLAVRFPIYTASTAVSSTWVETAEQNRTVFKMRSSHWAFNLVANLVYAHWSAALPVVQQRIVAKEAAFAADVAAMDRTAAALLKDKGVDAAVAALTNFSVQTGDRLVDEWNTFFGELFVRFSDGFDTSAIPRPPPAPGAPAYTPGGTSTVKVKELGYDEGWYVILSDYKCDLLPRSLKQSASSMEMAYLDRMYSLFASIAQVRQDCGGRWGEVPRAHQRA